MTDGQTVTKISEPLEHLDRATVRPGGVTYRLTDVETGLVPQYATAPWFGKWGDFEYSHDTDRLYVLCDTVPHGPVDKTDVSGMLVYDFSRKGWTQHRNIGAQSVLSTDAALIFQGNTGAYQLSEATIEYPPLAVMVSKPLLGEFGTQRGTFVLNQVRLLWDHCGGGYVHLVPIEAGIEQDGNVLSADAQTAPYYASDADKVGTGVADTMKVRDVGPYYQDIDGGALRGRAFQIVFESRNTFKLLGIELDYMPQAGVD
jgi:hypothetical protein